MADTKDWTWVLERQCPECGFDAASLERARVGDTLRSANDRLIELIGTTPDARQRPEPEVWSALEYGCHVRDVHRLFLHRLQRMLGEDAPRFENWDQDATAAESRYDEADLDQVLADLASDGERLAAAYDHIQPDQWARTGHRSDGAVFTVETFGRYLVHDPTHHVWDVEQGDAKLRG
jgi:DinB superfamily